MKNFLFELPENVSSQTVSFHVAPWNAFSLKTFGDVTYPVLYIERT